MSRVHAGAGCQCLLNPEENLALSVPSGTPPLLAETVSVLSSSSWLPAVSYKGPVTSLCVSVLSSLVLVSVCPSPHVSTGSLSCTSVSCLSSPSFLSGTWLCFQKTSSPQQASHGVEGHSWAFSQSYFMWLSLGDSVDGSFWPLVDGVSPKVVLQRWAHCSGWFPQPLLQVLG